MQNRIVGATYAAAHQMRHYAMISCMCSAGRVYGVFAMSMYLGEQCKYCGCTYETLDDLRTTVWAGEHEHGPVSVRDVLGDA